MHLRPARQVKHRQSPLGCLCDHCHCDGVIVMTDSASGSPLQLSPERIRRGAQRVVGLARGLPCGTRRPDSWV